MRVFDINPFEIEKMMIRGMDVKPLGLKLSFDGSDTSKNQSQSIYIDPGFPFMLHQVLTNHIGLVSDVKASINLNNSKFPLREPVSLDLLWGQGYNQTAIVNPQDKTGVKLGAKWDPISIPQNGFIEVRLSRALAPGETAEFLFMGERIRGLKNA